MVREQTRRFAVACLAAAVVVLVDQATKAAALGGLSQEERIPLLGDLLGLQLAFNPGAILSLGAGVTGLLTLLGVGAVVLLVVAAARARTDPAHPRESPPCHCPATGGSTLRNPRHSWNTPG